MIKQNTNSKKGFTIIEVVLVLAIAGLIFLMVFIAWPALQRNQRDTQRRNDYSMLSSAISSYSTNNNGKLVKILGSSATATGTYSVTLPAKQYINKDGEDPDGKPYVLTAVSCGASSGNCKNKITGTPAAQNVYVVIGADCTGTASNGKGNIAFPKYNNSSRAFAIYGYLESGNGTYCKDSQ